jgi:hypothetical protein
MHEGHALRTPFFAIAIIILQRDAGFCVSTPPLPEGDSAGEQPKDQPQPPACPHDPFSRHVAFFLASAALPLSD